MKPDKSDVETLTTSVEKASQEPPVLADNESMLELKRLELKKTELELKKTELELKKTELELELKKLEQSKT